VILTLELLYLRNLWLNPFRFLGSTHTLPDKALIALHGAEGPDALQDLQFFPGESLKVFLNRPPA
jgi:hypothetical protein